MGYTLFLEASSLDCRTKRDAEAASAIFLADPWLSNLPMRVSVRCSSSPSNDQSWYLEVEEFCGDHWNDEEANRAWLQIAPHLADGATMEFQGEDSELSRIRFDHGRVFEEYVGFTTWAVAREILPSEKENTA